MLVTYMRARLGYANQEGQTLVEYALIISLIALAAVAALTFLGGGLTNIFSAIGSKV